MKRNSYWIRGEQTNRPPEARIGDLLSESDKASNDWTRVTIDWARAHKDFEAGRPSHIRRSARLVLQLARSNRG